MKKLCSLFLAITASSALCQVPVLKSTNQTGTGTTNAEASVIMEDDKKIGIGQSIALNQKPLTKLHLYQLEQAAIFNPNGPNIPGIGDVVLRLDFKPIGGSPSRVFDVGVDPDGFFVSNDGFGTSGILMKIRTNGRTEFYNEVKVAATTLGSAAIDNTVSISSRPNLRMISWSNNSAESSAPLTIKYDPAGTSNDVTILQCMTDGQVRIGDPNNSFPTFVDGSGNSAEQARLVVDGTVIGRGYKATMQNWADFVFQPGNINPTLEQEMQSIALNGTLVGVPGENEIINGPPRNLADNDVMLLMKLEQNYLHDIEQMRQIASLQEQVKLLALKLEILLSIPDNHEK